MNSLRLVFFLIHVLSGGGCVCQPVFTYSDFAPQSGDQYTVVNSQYINPGASGMNQTWNFSTAIQSGNATYTVPPVSGIPCGNQYPNCNLGIGTGGYEMMQITSTEYNCLGNTITPGQANFVYSDVEKRFAFPLNYNNNFSDAFSGVSNVTQTINRNGTQTVTYDGYGTIITPIGTYNNAIRIRRTVTWTDSSQSGSSSCSGDYYYWFAPGYRYPVAQIWSLNCLSTGAMFLQSITIGVNELESALLTVSVFPNPFSSTLQINFSEQCLQQTATITDATGRILRTFVISCTSMNLDLADLKAGLYLIGVGDNMGVFIVKTDP